MSGETRPARADEIPRLWPVVRASHVLSTVEALASLRDEAPWSVRVSDHGDAMLLSRWRHHLDVLAIRGLWAPGSRVPDLVSDVRAVARAHGFGRVLSPLLILRESAPYRDAGMDDEMRLVAFTASVGSVKSSRRPFAADAWVLRSAGAGDADALAALDIECFDDFWRHSAPELREAVTFEHASAALAPDGRVIAYAISNLRGSTVTVARLAVASAHRRSGVGSALLGDAAQWADRQGALGLSLCTQEENAAARALYQSTGFTQAPHAYGMLLCSA